MPAGLTMDPGGTYSQAVHGGYNSRGVTFPHGRGYFRGIFPPVPARGRFSARPRVCNKDSTTPSARSPLLRFRAVFFSYYTTLFFL